jgi:3-dehydroquinate synthase
MNQQKNQAFGHISLPPTIFLYGPSGSGKTTIGRNLAEKLNAPFTDLDEEIESHSGKTIPQIFKSEGESNFRKREKEALLRTIRSERGVIALGGGALLDPHNRVLVEKHGDVICLTADPEVLFTRLSDDATQRPLLFGDPQNQLKELLERRSTHYDSFDIQLNTEKQTPDEIAWDICVRLGIFHIKGMGVSLTSNKTPSSKGTPSTGYYVRVKSDLLGSAGVIIDSLGLNGPIGLVTDENVAALYADRVRESLNSAGFEVHTIVIPAGEEYKTIQTVTQIWNELLKGKLDRSSLVLALGGGVVGDLAGFAAAAYLRGISWAAIPTTLLAMVDASLGGKTGADLPQGKNLVGAFHAPRLVLADPLVLKTLPDIELRSGLAEVVKHGIIGDPELFALCAEGWDFVKSNWDNIVPRAMAVKMKVIQDDPYEQGVRAVLNLGHTVGHAIEHASGFEYRHGEAVAIGMLAESLLSEKLNLADSGLSDLIAACLKKLGLPTKISQPVHRPASLQAMTLDKKRAQGQVKFSLPVRVGEVKPGVPVGDLNFVLDLIPGFVNGE